MPQTGSRAPSSTCVIGRRAAFPALPGLSTHAAWTSARSRNRLSRLTYDAIVAALADPAIYPDRPERVEHVQTHISHVFLAGRHAYKLKKPVRFPFLDFATAEQRRHFCEEEVRLNRRLCPAVYLGVVPITAGPDGAPRFGGSGAAVEHAVWMRRLPEDGMLTRRLAAGDVPPETMDRLARLLARFHADAATDPEIAAPERLAARWEEEMGDIAPFVGRLLAAEDHEILADFGPRFVRTHETLLRARQQAGRIREGHGDLHARNVCIVDERTPAADLEPGIYVFDCIEFSRDFRLNDVASEIAFLAMDLEARGHLALARRFVAAYVDAAADPMVPLLLPFYVAYRACVRGKVEGLEAAAVEVDPAEREQAERTARDLFALAVRHAWAAAGPAVIACTGLSGSGKTTLAEAIAAATGFELVSSDRLRRAAGAPGGAEPYGTGHYTPAAREAVYDALCEAVDRALAAERGVIVDATFIRAEDRQRLGAVAKARRRPVVFLECTADEAVVHARLRAREHSSSLSDARWETYLAQRARREPFDDGEPHIAVDTSGSSAETRARALRALWRWRHGQADG